MNGYQLVEGQSVTDEAPQRGDAVRSRRVPVGWRVVAAAAYVSVLAFAVVWQRWSIAIAASLGATAPVVVPALLRVAQELWRDRFVRVALIVSALLTVLFWRGLETSWNYLLVENETVPYRAQAILDGAVLQVNEQITVKSDKTDPDWAKGTAWQLDRIVDGSPVYRRSREVPLRRVSWAEWEVEVRIEIGRLDSAYLVPKEGSKIIISAPKGSLGVTSPVAQQLVDVPRHQELATVPLEPYDDRVVVAVRPLLVAEPDRPGTR